MNRGYVVLGGLLGLSLLVNAVCIVRLNRPEAPPAARPSVAKGGEEARQDPSVPKATEAPATTPTGAPSETPPAKAPAKPGTGPSFVNDPKVREVLDAQDLFGAYWKDLDRVFKARDRLDDASYIKTILAATGDYLELNDAQRAQFADAAQTAVQALATARKEYEDGRKALPPKGDKNDAAARAAYDEQRNALDARYDQRFADVVTNLKTPLEPGRARHAEFIAHMDKWLKNLAKTAQ